MKLLTTQKHKLLALGVCLFPAIGFAQGTEDLSYGYVEVDYINLDVDEPGEDDPFDNDFDNGDGYGISVSFPITEAFFVFADYSDTESDFTFTDNLGVRIPGNTHFLRFNLGAGFVLPMSDTTDVVFAGAYADLDFNKFDFGGTSDPDLDDLDDDPSDGYMVDVKLRSQLGEMLEGSIGARYTDIESSDGLSIIGNLMWEFTQNWAANLSVDAGDDLMTWGLGVRYSY